MRFLIHKRRTAPAVIIVALIDVLIVLVIFLLVTTTFKQQPALKLALPTSTSALKSGANENPPQVVYIDDKNLLRFGPNAEVVTPDQLRSRLIVEAEKIRASGQEPMLAVRADKNAHWERVVQVMDIGKAANIRVLSAYTKEAGK
ncbi:MAG TPA: biopolymer transporter ExbD [Verrucomicrobiae bacterium]|nr:biopolymer transporter ExbD [Verrucomicrobiae bacterium]